MECNKPSMGCEKLGTALGGAGDFVTFETRQDIPNFLNFNGIPGYTPRTYS
jgi:hypothetical protein